MTRSGVALDRAHFESVTFSTCVARPDTYEECRRSILALETGTCAVRIDPVDNTTNRHSCAAAYNRAWDDAETDLLVFCHDDVVFPADWLLRVREGLAVLALQVVPWGVAGPIGRRDKTFLGHALDHEGNPSRFGPLPARVDTLDELCLVVRRDLPLRFDERLGGFHLYGVDLCIQAAEAGYAAYALDAPCRHNSTTRHRPAEYHVIKRRLQRKWMFGRRHVGRSIGTTCGRIRFGLLRGWL